MRIQIKKISGEESHSSEGKKKIRIPRKMSEHWNGNSEKKAQSYRIKVKILTLKQNLSVSAQKSKKKKKVRIPRFMSEFSERRILKKARILGSDLKIPKKLSECWRQNSNIQSVLKFILNSNTRCLIFQAEL